MKESYEQCWYYKGRKDIVGYCKLFNFTCLVETSQETWCPEMTGSYTAEIMKYAQENMDCEEEVSWS